MPLAKEGVISDHLKRDAFISNKGTKGNRSVGKWENPPTLPLRTRVSFKHLLTQRVSNLLSTLSCAQIATFLPLWPLPPQSTLPTYSQSSLIQAGIMCKALIMYWTRHINYWLDSILLNDSGQKNAKVILIFIYGNESRGINVKGQWYKWSYFKITSHKSCFIHPVGYISLMVCHVE